MKALLLDDDPWSLALLSRRLSERFPEMTIEARREPDISGAHDVYFLDNDFEGRPLAAELTRQVRAIHPGALIVAFSATLDAPILRGLINSGCDGACDKSDPDEVAHLLEIVEAYRAARAARRSPWDLRGALRDMAELLREWNRRLDRTAPRAP